MKYSFERLFYPKSIAVIGANEKTSYAGKTMRNLLGNEFDGPIYPVTPTHPEVFGIKSYPSITDIPDVVDLAIIIVKADVTVDVVKECIEKGVGGILIITAGFKELDPVHGPEREEAIQKLAEESGVPIIGPNCIGFANVYNNMWSCGISELPKNPLPKGNAAIISQSGAAGFGPLLSIARDRKIGIKYIVSTGNEAVLNICDYLEYCLNDPDIRAISMLIEGFKDPKRFVELAKRAEELGKTLIAIKSGESDVGSRAAKSHTASMTGDMAVFNAICKQYGIIKAEDYDELIELARMAQHEDALKTRKVCVVSHSGGIAGFTGDQLGKRGFSVPEFSEETKQHIDSYLKGFGSPNNPLDLTGQMRSENIGDILLTVEKNENVGAFVISCHGSGARFDNIVNAIKGLHVPVYFNWTGSMYSTEGINKLLEMDVPFSFSIQKMAIMLDKMVTAFETRSRYQKYNTTNLDLRLPAKKGLLSEPEAKEILKASGVSVPKKWIINTEKEAVEAWQNTDKGKKYVLKIVSDTVIHKTDIGGVKLGIKESEEFFNAYQELVSLKNSRNDIKSVVLEEMCDDGLDMVVGVRDDEQFGPIIMVGLGGIYTELFKMVSIKKLPVSDKDIEQAVSEIPGLMKLFNGYRGHCGYDLQGLTKTIKYVSNLVVESNGKVSLLEINPLRVLDKGKGVYALDCVMELR